jgi:hypothetical protein
METERERVRDEDWENYKRWSFALLLIVLGWLIEEGCNVLTPIGRSRKCIKIWIGKTGNKIPHVRTRHRWKHDAKMRNRLRMGFGSICCRIGVSGGLF